MSPFQILCDIKHQNSWKFTPSRKPPKIVPGTARPGVHLSETPWLKSRCAGGETGLAVRKDQGKTWGKWGCSEAEHAASVGAESPVSGERDMFKLRLTGLRDTAGGSLTPGGKLNQMDLEFTGDFHYFKKPYRSYTDYMHHTTSSKNRHRFKTSISRPHSLLNQSLWE